jgi:hypothetical protein
MRLCMVLVLSRCVQDASFVTDLESLLCVHAQVIGKGGENINKMEAESGCKIQLTPKEKQANWSLPPLVSLPHSLFLPASATKK